MNGSRGRVAVVGKPSAAPPVVFIGSPQARIEVYRPTVTELARRGQVFAVELPGAGPPRLTEPLTLDRYAAWTAGCVDALGVEDATLAGHSHAAGVALLVAARHPARIGRLVVADGIGTGPHPFWRCFWGRLADTALVELGLALRAGHHLLYSFAAHPVNFVRQTRASLTADLLADAGRVLVPTLLAWGGRDRTLPPACAGRFAAHLPEPTVYTSPGGSHCWPITHAAEFAEVVAGWAGQVGRRANHATPHHAASTTSTAASAR